MHIQEKIEAAAEQTVEGLEEQPLSEKKLDPKQTDIALDKERLESQPEKYKGMDILV